MKRENILFLIVVVTSITPQLGVIWSILKKFKLTEGKQLFLQSGIVWIAWVISTILTMLFLVTTESTSSFPTIKFMIGLHFMRIAFLTFINTGLITGVLYLLKSYGRKQSSSRNIWFISFILSIVTSFTLYALILLSFFILESFFGTF